MRILHIVHIDHLGNGIAVVVNELSKAQQKLNNEVMVVNFRTNSWDIDGFIKCNNLQEFLKIITNFKPEIAIIHGVFYTEIKSISKALVKLNIPYVIEPHGAYSRENYRKNTYKKWLFKKIYLNNVVRFSNGWIFLNDSERNNFALSHKKPIYIIPNGCSHHHTSIHKYLAKNKIQFLYIGRIAIHHKGLDLLIDAITQLDNNLCKNIEFKFYGPGTTSDIEKFKIMIKPLSNIITYHGPIFGKEKKEVIKNSDIFILTSRFEGFPMAILEAMSYGKPCLVSTGTNVTNIINKYNCGWCIPNLTVSHIANAIKLSIDEYTRNSDTYAKNAITASEEYDWKKIAEFSIEKYTDIIQSAMSIK